MLGICSFVRMGGLATNAVAVDPGAGQHNGFTDARQNHATSVPGIRYIHDGFLHSVFSTHWKDPSPPRQQHLQRVFGNSLTILQNESGG